MEWRNHLRPEVPPPQNEPTPDEPLPPSALFFSSNLTTAKTRLSAYHLCCNSRYGFLDDGEPDRMGVGPVARDAHLVRQDALNLTNLHTF